MTLTTSTVKSNTTAKRYGFEWVISCENHKDFYNLYHIAEEKFGQYMIFPLSYFAKAHNYYKDHAKIKFALQFNINRKHNIDNPDKIFFKSKKDMELVLSLLNSK